MNSGNKKVGGESCVEKCIKRRTDQFKCKIKANKTGFKRLIGFFLFLVLFSLFQLSLLLCGFIAVSECSCCCEIPGNGNKIHGKRTSGNKKKGRVNRIKAEESDSSVTEFNYN